MIEALIYIEACGWQKPLCQNKDGAMGRAINHHSHEVSLSRALLGVCRTHTLWSRNQLNPGSIRRVLHTGLDRTNKKHHIKGIRRGFLFSFFLCFSSKTPTSILEIGWINNTLKRHTKPYIQKKKKDTKPYIHTKPQNLKKHVFCRVVKVVGVVKEGTMFWHPTFQWPRSDWFGSPVGLAGEPVDRMSEGFSNF